MSDGTQRIRDLLAERGLRPAVFARSIGIPQSTMSTIYHGKTRFENIRVEHFLAIAHGLGMTADELWSGAHPEGLSRDERDLVDMYRATADAGREAISSVARTLSGRVDDTQGGGG